ncbi:hypothetical protein Mgrana_00534 [Meiothermus granaticius NBRC 107808]|uniref:Transposase, Mutator family n=1 Tax=Meiothermus granaticius NBRC 107808 TaxID=1227551 RepID=A0A399FBF3_9DEIN|nr:hypothetical protein Mgrana_00534 [Meiothermus granaticius NBRC 107808]
MLRGLSKRLIERALETELTVHLGHQPGGVAGNPAAKEQQKQKDRTS